MPIVGQHEFTFGDVACVVITTSEPFPEATLYVVVNDGQALRPLVDNAGGRIRFVGQGATREVLGLAMDYLEARFGPRGPARPWNAAPFGHGRVVLDEPLRPGDRPSRESA
jgi:hypothetical protein